MKLLKTVALVAAAALCAPCGALACAACFGKSDSNMAQSLNAGIFTLMGFIVAVLGGAASFFVFLARRSAVDARRQDVDQPEA